MSAVRLDVWSDFVCPFCYLAEPALARVEEEFGAAVEIAWRAFELRPEPEPTLDPAGAYLRDIWDRAVYPMARERGMTLRLPPLQPRSHLAHEATAHAATVGRSAPMIHAIFVAFFENGEDIGDPEVLASLAVSAGVAEAGLRAALVDGRHRSAVVADETLAAELGLSGVPAIVVRRAGDPFAQAALISGAQPYDVIARAVRDFAARPAKLAP